MSRPAVDEGGFSPVSYKGKRKRHRKQNVPSSFIRKHAPDTLQNFNMVISNIQDELKCSDFIVHFKEDLLSVLNEWDLGHIIGENLKDDLSSMPDALAPVNKKQDIDVVCYGLGQFSSCIIARYQLGFLLILNQILHAVHVYVYDPQFSIEEINFLNELGLNVISVNEEAKRTLKGKSVCFLPHCDLPLYNNLLWANWNAKCLSELVIIGNSFQTYELNDVRGCLKERAKYVYMANQFITEIRMANVFRFNDIFNDLSIHYFKSNSLSSVDPFVWTYSEEPEYSDGDDIIKSI